MINPSLEKACGLPTDQAYLVIQVLKYLALTLQKCENRMGRNMGCSEDVEAFPNQISES